MATTELAAVHCLPQDPRRVPVRMVALRPVRAAGTKVPLVLRYVMFFITIATLRGRQMPAERETMRVVRSIRLTTRIVRYQIVTERSSVVRR
jgi:hypothetical protein